VVWLGCLFLLKKDMRAKSEMAGEYSEIQIVRLLVQPRRVVGRRRRRRGRRRRGPTSVEVRERRERVPPAD